MSKLEKLTAVKGMNDILPPESARWEWLEAKMRSVLLRYGYQNVRTPIVEPTALFVRGIGEVPQRVRCCTPDGRLQHVAKIDVVERIGPARALPFSPPVLDDTVLHERRVFAPANQRPKVGCCALPAHRKAFKRASKPETDCRTTLSSFSNPAIFSNAALMSRSSCR